jgi:hypothetical protein
VIILMRNPDVARPSYMSTRQFARIGYNGCRSCGGTKMLPPPPSSQK